MFLVDDRDRDGHVSEVCGPLFSEGFEGSGWDNSLIIPLVPGRHKLSVAYAKSKDGVRVQSDTCQEVEFRAEERKTYILDTIDFPGKKAKIKWKPRVTEATSEEVSKYKLR